MKCPNCDTTLVMTERSGVEIDYCPNCRGVWLDRGELDKIIERSAPSDQSDYRRGEYGRDDYSDRQSNRDYPPNKKKRRGSFLGDLFDFD